MILQTKKLHQSEHRNKQIEPKELFNAHSNAVLYVLKHLVAGLFGSWL